MPGLLALEPRRVALALASSSSSPYKISTLWLLLLVVPLLIDLSSVYLLLSPRFTRSTPGLEAFDLEDLDFALASSSLSPYKTSTEVLVDVAVRLLVVALPLLLRDMSSDENLLSLRLARNLSSLLVPLGTFILGLSSSSSLFAR